MLGNGGRKGRLNRRVFRKAKRIIGGMKMKKNRAAVFALLVFAVAFLAGCASFSERTAGKPQRVVQPGITEDGEFEYGQDIFSQKEVVIMIVSYRGSSKTPVIPREIQGYPVWRIRYSAFQGKGITGITIPDTVKSIDYDAFADNQLTSVVIPGSVEQIGQRAFQNNQLTRITLEDGVKGIDNYAFENNKLESVTIPESVNNISYLAFGNNPLASVTLRGKCSLSQEAFPFDMWKYYLFADTEGPKTYSLREGKVVINGVPPVEPATLVKSSDVYVDLVDREWPVMVSQEGLNFYYIAPGAHVLKVRYAGIYEEARLDYEYTFAAGTSYELTVSIRGREAAFNIVVKD
jgi:hypothetical protein